jgi:uncharacterized membrane protein (UPF0182 family)
LKRVVVAYQNTVIMNETLEGALASIFGGSVAGLPSSVATPGTARTAGTAAPVFDPQAADLLQQIQSHYDRAMNAQRAGNWAEYGSEIQRVGELLRQLNARIGGR